MAVSAGTRRPDVDALRVVATLLLFPFHVGMVFNPAPFYHIRNDELSFVWLVVCGFIGLWHMPLFFVLAGWSLCESLRARGATGVLRERARRLLVPFLFACGAFMPVIKYLELSSGLDLNHAGLRVSAALQPGFQQVIPLGLPVAAPFDETFLEFLPTFLSLERFTWAHLWFVAYLLTFTVVYLPALGWLLRRPTGAGAIPPWGMYLPVVPLVAVQLVLRPHWPGIQNLYDDWANVAYYSTFLVAGFLLARDPRLEDVACAEWRRAFGIGLATCVVLLGGVLGVFDAPPVVLAGSAVAGWCFVLAAVGIARRFVTRGGPVLEYLSEAAFPVYVLHQAAIVVPGYFLLGLPLGLWLKALLVLSVAVAVTFATYHVLVRPLPALRVLFGMRPPVCALRTSTVRAVAIVVVAAIPCAATSVRAGAPEGLWYAEGGAAKVDVHRCGRRLCATVVWLRSPFDENGCPLRDLQNADGRLRRRPIEGMELLSGLEQSANDENVWSGGTIYDPTTGHTFRCRLTVDGDRLFLRGYLGVPALGRTTTWIRVGAEARTCHAAVTAAGE